MSERLSGYWRLGLRHDLIVEGHGFRLRPVEIEDAAFILNLRSDPARNQYIHRGATDLLSQQEWLEKYFARGGDYYFVIENRATGEAEGTVGIYDVNRAERTAEWGRWIVRAGSLAALESACLMYSAAFDRLDLDSVYCRTILENKAALGFHDSFQVERTLVLPQYFESNGRWLDAVEGQLTRARWLTLPFPRPADAARAPRARSAPAIPMQSNTPTETAAPGRSLRYDR
jgi:RimJ/RimL family protein N-acetyltransferase